MTEAARRRLGQHASQRRRALGMTAAEAARIAEVNPKTWDAIEKGTRVTRDSNYAGIERALQWASGSVEAVLDGRAPTSVPNDQGEHASERAKPDPYLDPATGEVYQDEVERDIWRLHRLPAETRRAFIYQVRAQRAAEDPRHGRAAS